MAEQLPTEIYSLAGYREPDGRVPGFDILYEPRDESPCDDKDGQCHNVAHLWPIARVAGRG